MSILELSEGDDRIEMGRKMMGLGRLLETWACLSRTQNLVRFSIRYYTRSRIC